MKMNILPPTNASKLMRHLRSALLRAVMSRRAQLVVRPLFWRGVFSFSGGIGEDVLGNLFSSKDLLREQVKAENEEG
jgi:hypothetical protein